MAPAVNVLFHALVPMVNERPKTEFGLIRPKRKNGARDRGPPRIACGVATAVGHGAVEPQRYNPLGDCLKIQALASSSDWKPVTCSGTRPSCHETRTYHSEPAFDGRAVNVGFDDRSSAMGIL